MHQLKFNISPFFIIPVSSCCFHTVLKSNPVTINRIGGRSLADQVKLDGKF